MSRGLSARKTGFLAVVTALALPGGVAAILLASGGSFTSELAATVQQTPAAPALAAAAPSGQGATSPIGGPRRLASPAATAPASSAPKIVAMPPPVVDGVPRVDVGLAHSPQIQQQLSASAPAGAPPVGAGALGVDVADYQHRNGALIDWPQVAAAGYKFAFVKATEGDYYVNPWYAYDLAQAKAAGLYVAGYHFAIPNVSDGASQADYALQNGAYTRGRENPAAGARHRIQPVRPRMLRADAGGNGRVGRLVHGRGEAAHRAAADHLHHRRLVEYLHRRQRRVRR